MSYNTKTHQQKTRILNMGTLFTITYLHSFSPNFVDQNVYCADKPGTKKRNTTACNHHPLDNKKNPIKGMNDSPQKCFRKRGKKYIAA